MLSITAKSGVSAGWRPTNAAFFVAALLAMYGDEFGWNEIEEFKSLNNIEDWEPSPNLRADGVLIPNDGSGKIYLPEGFDLSGWQEYFTPWRNGQVIATLPPEIKVSSWFPPTSTPTPTPTPSQTTAQPSSPTSTPQPIYDAPQTSQQSATGPGGVPVWAWALGGAVGVAVLSAMFKKKGRR